MVCLSSHCFLVYLQWSKTFDHGKILGFQLVLQQISNINQGHKREAILWKFLILVSTSYYQLLGKRYTWSFLYLFKRMIAFNVGTGIFLKIIQCNLVFNSAIIPIKHGHFQKLNRYHLFIAVYKMTFIQINTRLFNVFFFLIKYRKQFDNNFLFGVLFDSERSYYVTLVENHLFNWY